MKNRKKIIFDCDNTVGIEGYPMDDALAFLYLLGNPDRAEILGFTCTFGNDTVEKVYESSRALLSEVKCDLPLLRGAETGEEPVSEAARFIAETANRYPQEVNFLGIGSATNLYGAWLLDPDLFEKLNATVLMGGITEPLYTHGALCPELNFSVNKKASANVLSHGKHISVITGNNCLAACYLPKTEFMQRMQAETNPVGAYIAKKCGYRFSDKKSTYGEEGSYCWDVLASAYLLYPEFFEDDMTLCAIGAESLSDGSLMPSKNGNAVLNLPKVKDAEKFRHHLYDSWLAVPLTT